MARMEHIPCPPPQPESRPELPKGALPLVPTPEKSKPAKAATGKGANAKGRKKVSFSNELSKAASSGQNCVSHTTEHQCSGYNEFCSLTTPAMNSTLMVTKKLEQLRESKFDEVEALRQLTEEVKMHSVNQKASAALNFKKSETKYKGLVSLEIDKDREIRTLSQKKVNILKHTSKTVKSQKSDNATLDVMAFWTPDLVTETPKLDYDKDIDRTLWEPDLSMDSSEFLLDMYNLREISSQYK